MVLSGNRNSHGSSIFTKLKAIAVVSCALAGSVPGYAFQAPPQQTVSQGLPPAPAPNYTQPLFMRPGPEDYTKARGYWPNPIAPYRPITAPPASFLNSPRLPDLLKNGKIYLSLSDAIMLALENNFDIAIQRFNLNIADTEILRAHAGAGLLGVNSGLVTGTIGSTGTTVTGGGGPGGTSVASGGAGTGNGGLALTTNGGGPVPENMDPVLSGTVQLQRQNTAELNPLFYGTSELNQNTNTYNFAYNQGFISGTALNVTFNNSYTTSNSAFNTYSPALQTTFNAQVTQHLLQGFGWGVNGRFIVQAKNNRRIADSAFRSQLLYTINQVENIYWGLVSAYEDLQSRQRALEQSTRLLEDDKKSLEIGTLAPLDVVNANSQVETDKQGLITSQSNLEYQQLVMKQAIARTLEDPAIANAPVIPTDRVSLVETPEERESADDLVRLADANSPSIEQAILNLKNDEITLKGVKNGMLPTVDAYAFYGASALGGAQSPNCVDFFTSSGCAPGTYPSINYGNAFQNLFDSSSPNKGVGVQVNIPLRNRTAQAEQARSVLEYRQAQMRLQQLYVQTRMNVVNAQFALTNDRASVQSAMATRDYDRQSLESELKKLHLGASTTANVLQQQRTLATAENSVISATAKYAIDRASLSQILASTLDRYNISIADAVSGNVKQAPVIPGLEAAKPGQEVTVPGQQQNLQNQEANPNPHAEPPPAQPPLTQRPQ
ncbi:TolC family protein [Silvibacterium acidisoli]|uniref:TolC family protein n=1 Tax=Acidobacteriaceae bacterium ZG23-2 TaxID=2883246 RepID=UPI00406C1572